jgi:hypothetical protein
MQKVFLVFLPIIKPPISCRVYNYKTPITGSKELEVHGLVILKLKHLYEGTHDRGT